MFVYLVSLQRHVNTNRSFCDGLHEEGNQLRRSRIANETTIHTIGMPPTCNVSITAAYRKIITCIQI